MLDQRGTKHPIFYTYIATSELQVFIDREMLLDRAGGGVPDCWG